MRHAPLASILPILSLLFLPGCPIAPRTPQQATVEPAEARAIDLILAGGHTTYCPHGAPEQIKAVVTLADGRTLSTWSRGASRENTLGFDAFEVSSSYGAVDADGMLRIPADPFAALDRKITITARLVGRPELSNQVTIEPTFDCSGSLGGAGLAGRSGERGRDGLAGRPGRSSTSSNPATDGEDGQDGQAGGPGSDGGPGPTVDVALTYVDTPSKGRLILIRVGGRRVLVSPEAPHFGIYAVGGPGGPGGSGGSGGAGGHGGSAYTKDTGDGGNGGDGGDGGAGGDGGVGGDGGEIRVYYDDRFPELADAIATSTAGGVAGSAGSGGFGGAAGSGGGAASPGRSGQMGRRGRSGSSGRRGSDGRPGRGVSRAAVPVDELFRDELAEKRPIAGRVATPDPG